MLHEIIAPHVVFTPTAEPKIFPKAIRKRDKMSVGTILTDY